MKSNQSRPGFELVSPCPFPTTITTTPRAPQCESMVVIACHRFTRPKRSSKMWINAYQWSTRPKRSSAMWIYAYQWFTRPKRSSAMWIYAYQCLSMIHLAQKVKCNVNLCLSMIHLAQKIKCNVNLCLSMLINDSPGPKDQVQCESMFSNAYQRFIRLKGQVQCEFLLVINTLPAWVTGGLIAGKSFPYKYFHAKPLQLYPLT